MLLSAEVATLSDDGRKTLLVHFWSKETAIKKPRTPNTHTRRYQREIGVTSLGFDQTLKLDKDTAKKID